MTAEEINRNIYLGKTTTTERPFADDPVRRYADPPDLARHQRMWDQAKQWDDGNAKARADHLAAVAADRETEAAKQKASLRADLEARLRSAYLANPATTVNDWERNKQGLIDAELAKSPIDQRVADLRRDPQYSSF